MKTYRIYYNRSTERQCWSVDEGTQDSEITVMGIELNCVSGIAKVDPMAPSPSDKFVRAWIEISGAKLTIENGIAVFKPIEEVVFFP